MMSWKVLGWSTITVITYQFTKVVVNPLELQVGRCRLYIQEGY